MGELKRKKWHQVLEWQVFEGMSLALATTTYKIEREQMSSITL